MRREHNSARNRPVASALSGAPQLPSRGKWFNLPQHAHSVLLTNAAAVSIATFSNGLLGFVFWWIAAREFAPAAVGLAGAAISIMSLVSLIGEFGISTLLAGEVPRRRDEAPQLIATSIVVASALSAGLGLIYVTAVWLFSSPTGVNAFSLLTGSLIVIGAGVQTACIALDSSLVAMLRGKLRFQRNVLFSVFKLLFLCAAAFIGTAMTLQRPTIIATWVLAQIAATLGIAVYSGWNGWSLLATPQFDILRPLMGRAIWHHIVNVVTAAPALIIPSVISVLLTPEETAPFFAAWMMLNMAIIIPAALTTVLFSNAARDPSQTVPQFRLSLSLSLAAGLAAAIGFYALSNFLLGLLNPIYAVLGGNALRCLGLSVLLTAIKTHYIAVARIEHALPRAAAVLAIGSSLELGLAVTGAYAGGLSGLTSGWLMGMGIGVLFQIPVILRAAQIVPPSASINLARRDMPLDSGRST